MNYTPKVKYSLSQKSINNYIIRHKQCQQINDKYYIISINPYVNDLLKSYLPISTEVNSLGDGIYIYIVLGFDDDEPSLYIIKTLTMYEFGTKHQQLVHRIACENNVCKKYKLFYAGELMKHGDNVLFNFYSGTFDMKNKILKKTKHYDVQFMEELIHRNASHVTVEFTDDPIITEDKFILTYEDLQLFKSFGASIFEFDSLEECKNYKDYFNVNPSYNPNERSKLMQKMLTVSNAYGGKKTKKHKKYFK